MNDNTCPRCSSKFFTSMTGTDLNCPFCGFAIIGKSAELKRRWEERSVIQRNCYISKEGMKVTAQTVDISSKGLGIKLYGSIPLEKDDVLYVVIRDFEIDSNAKVVWTQASNAGTFKAGLRFF